MRTISNKILSFSLVGVFALSSVSGFADSGANADPMGINPGAIDPSGIKAKKVDYDQFCNAIQNSHDTVLGSDGKSSYKQAGAGAGDYPDFGAFKNETADYCNRRDIAVGAPTARPSPNASAIPGSMPTGGNVWLQGNNYCTLTVPADGSCPGRVMTCQDQDGNPTMTESCAQAKSRTDACKYAKLANDTQILQYCSAHQKAKKAQTGLAVMAAIDTAAALTCFIDAHGVKRGLQYACGAASLGAGAAELATALGLVGRDKTRSSESVDGKGNFHDNKNGNIIGAGFDAVGGTVGAGLGIGILAKCMKYKKDGTLRNPATETSTTSSTPSVTTQNNDPTNPSNGANPSLNPQQTNSQPGTSAVGLGTQALRNQSNNSSIGGIGVQTPPAGNNTNTGIGLNPSNVGQKPPTGSNTGIGSQPPGGCSNRPQFLCTGSCHWNGSFCTL